MLYRLASCETQAETENDMNSSARAETPRALRAWVTNGKVWIELEDGREIGFPTEKFPRLKGASSDDLAKVRIEARGKALRWEELDEDISVEGILAGRWHPALS